MVLSKELITVIIATDASNINVHKFLGWCPIYQGTLYNVADRLVLNRFANGHEMARAQHLHPLVG
jgi:hypothetical protein